MNLQKAGLFILAAAAAVMVAASTMDAVPFGAASFTAPLEQTQGNGAMAPASAVPYNHPANTPADATWGSLFSAHWR